jgi:ABC-type transporter Mla maintaining outer membrane lipid asymmetry ATPase subunit MlaF
MPSTETVAEPLVSLRDLHLSFAGNPVLNGIDLVVHRGQAVSIIGPSGSGNPPFCAASPGCCSHSAAPSASARPRFTP